MFATAEQNPEHLIPLARAGDEKSLGILLELYRNYLTLAARVEISRRLQSKVDPADLVQETFLHAHRGFPEFRGSTEFELVAWLRRILASNLANLMRHYFGTQARDIRLEQDLANDLEHSSRAWAVDLMARQSTPSQIAARREQAVLLADALAGLPSDYQEVIVLRHLEGLTFPQTAERMKRSVDSVEKLWIRALGKLRRTLGDPA